MHPVKVGEDAVLILEHVLPLLTLALPPDLIRHHQRPDEGGPRGEVEQKGT
jgi:hypothetical protein